MQGSSITCDDGDGCTGDTCDPRDGMRVYASCRAVSVMKEAIASDDNVCTGTETCNLQNNQCVPGTPVSCSDGNVCTTDSCDPAGGLPVCE